MFICMSGLFGRIYLIFMKCLAVCIILNLVIVLLIGYKIFITVMFKNEVFVWNKSSGHPIKN